MKRPQLPPDSGHERAHEVFLDALRTALTAARKLPGVDECDVRAAASTMAKVMQEFSSQWNPNRQCTGMKTKTKRCKTLIPYAKWCQKWPGVSDRCQWHEDPLEVRSRDLAKMAQRCGAAGKESWPTAKR